MNMYKRLAVLINHLIWVILAAVFVFFIFQSEHFLSENNILNIFSAAAVMGFLVVGQTFVLITGISELRSAADAK